MRALSALLVLGPTLALAEPPPPAELAKALCTGPCAVLVSSPAGKDLEGNDLLLVATAAARKPGEKLPRSEDEAERRCLPMAYALLHLQGGKLLRHEPVVTLRAKGCGSAHEEVRLGDNRLIFDVQGGQQWTFVELTTWQLAPTLQVVERYEEKFAHAGAPGQTVDRQLDTGLVTVERRLPYCGKVHESEGEAPPHESYRYIEIPRLEPQARAALDWKSAPMPRGLTIDASGRVGYVLAGEPGQPDDARVSVVALSDTELLIQVADNKRVAREGAARVGDALELYLGVPLPPFPSSCIPPAGAKRPPHDGELIAALTIPLSATAQDPDPHGQSAPKIDRALQPDGTVRLLLTFAHALESVSLVYSDTDDGQRIVRRIGTSTLKPDEPLTLGVIAAPAK